MSSSKFKYLVADTTAFINNVPLNEYAENVLTVPDVVNEVKNKRQIRRLVVLPFDLQVQEPNEDCLAFVTNFAKKTGDYASLSAIDLKVIALTYQLEKTNVGIEHLRQEPVVSKIIASKTKPEEFQDKTPLAGFYTPEGEENPEPLDVDEDEDDSEITEEQLRECFNKLSCESESDQPVDDILVPEKNISDNEDFDKNLSGSEDDIDEEDDDDTAWITPSNIKKVKKDMGADLEEEKYAAVACMTTDYAIQNVLKQINLNLAALNGRVIKHIRTYILRCYACFKTTSIMTKQFCPTCGNKTLKKVSVSLDENGQQVIHINSRRPLTAKFKNQSIPRPKGGKHSRNPILVEDQPIPKQMPSRVAKTKTNALDEDYIAGYSPFVLRDVDSKSALLRSKGNIKQWARNNLYEENRRKKGCTRLVK